MANFNSCCKCFGNTFTPNNNCNVTPNKCGDCLSLGHILVGCENSIAPCDTTNTLKIPFDCFCFPCDNPVFKVTNTSSIKYATVVSIDKTGITIKPDGTGRANSKVYIEFMAMCSDGCDVKSDYGSVSIYLKDLCKGVICPDGLSCNECTGICNIIDNDLSAQKPTNNVTPNSSGFVLEPTTISNPNCPNC